jgi:pimeloyl-ACP methyl ester carboxylesterase
MTTSATIKHDYADVNDIRMHYAHAGAGKLILFAHGFPEFWYCWKDILPEFARDHHAVAPDMRGYNLTSKPTDVAQYDIGILVEDLGALAKSLGHETFTLVAHDWGGGVAWSLAMRHPEWLERLIIVNSPHPTIFERELNINPAQQKASMYTRMFQSPKTEAMLSADDYKALRDTVVTDGLRRGHFTQADKAEYIKAWSQPGALTGSLNYYRAANMGPPMKPGESARSFETGVKDPIVRVPTLVIWGEQDPHLMTSNLDGLETYVPDLTVKRIPDGTHWVIHEQPKVVVQHIRAFLERA